MLSVTPIPALTDNYIWLLRQDHSQAVCIVDPGEAAPVIEYLEQHSLHLDTILVTHHHHDHTDGIPELVKRYAPQVIGPASSAIHGVTRYVNDGDNVHVLGHSFDVVATPGHTLDHLSFYAASTPGLLFCGDTLFYAGCGRLFEGTPQQMLSSLKRLMELPENTLVCAAHEYTVANLTFALAVEPSNEDIKNALQVCENVRAEGRPTLPTTLGSERKINPYLRVNIGSVRQSAGTQGDSGDELATFATIREWKNRF